MKTKLKLEITLFEKIFGYTSTKIYILRIKVLEKDNRFDDNLYIGNTHYFSSKNKITISTSNYYKKGFFNDNIIYFPSKENLNEVMSYSFFTDESRKLFLKRLYSTLNEWSNKWLQFKSDINNKIIVENNIWKITCINTNQKKDYFNSIYYE